MLTKVDVNGQSGAATEHPKKKECTCSSHALKYCTQRRRCPSKNSTAPAYQKHTSPECSVKFGCSVHPVHWPKIL